MDNLQQQVADLQMHQIALTEFIKETQYKLYLKDRVSHDTTCGITTDALCKEEVIVSLTSYGKRISEVYLAIESIMQGTMKPNRIILWLAEEERGKTLPITLLLQQQRGLQVEYCADIRSYKKLIPTLQKYKEAAIITVDDDIMYNIDFVENLVRSHIKQPNVVCANRIRKMSRDVKGTLTSYLQWSLEATDYSDYQLNFLTSGGGTIFPPHIFPNEVFNEKVFMEICPYADDVWINAMLRLKSVPIVKSFTHDSQGCDYVALTKPLERALETINTNPNHCLNDVQIKAVFAHYNIN
ncbi:MAG: hypothetical protein NC404_02970 [Bacteroidales bacterium]|nr:hypothetical protein [Bacteroidales bacterium]